MLRRIDHVAQILRQHSKEQHHALFIHWLMTQPWEVERISVSNPVFQRSVRCFALRGRSRDASFPSSPLLLWQRSGKQRHHIRPFPLSFGELTKGAWK
jgi:hypothetical protein